MSIQSRFVILLLALVGAACSSADPAEPAAVDPAALERLFVPSEAMAPTIPADSWVSIDRSLAPKVGDIVIFTSPDPVTDAPLLKRIVASGGQLVEFVDGNVVIDGSIRNEQYVAAPQSTMAPPTDHGPGCIAATRAATRCDVPDDHFYMLGDNRLGSEDSRVWGAVPASSVLGVVVDVEFPS